MAPPRTREGRSQLNALIDDNLFAEVQHLWRSSGNPKRWQIIEEILRLGVDAYKALPEDRQGEQQNLLQAG